MTFGDGYAEVGAEPQRQGRLPAQRFGCACFGRRGCDGLSRQRFGTSLSIAGERLSFGQLMLSMSQEPFSRLIWIACSSLRRPARVS